MTHKGKEWREGVLPADVWVWEIGNFTRIATKLRQNGSTLKAYLSSCELYGFSTDLTSSRETYTVYPQEWAELLNKMSMDALDLGGGSIEKWKKEIQELRNKTKIGDN